MSTIIEQRTMEILAHNIPDMAKALNSICVKLNELTDIVNQQNILISNQTKEISYLKSRINR